MLPCTMQLHKEMVVPVWCERGKKTKGEGETHLKHILRIRLAHLTSLMDLADSLLSQWEQITCGSTNFWWNEE